MKMGDSRLLVTSFVVMMAICLAKVPITLCASPEPPPMPSLLNRIGPDGSYHMMSELELNDGENKNRLVIEEWLSLSLGMSRVDVLQNGERITYLVNGKTGERFSYQDYTCNLLNTDWPNDINLSNYLRGVQIENHENFKKDVNVFGIGAMWMKAKRQTKKDYLKARLVPSLTRPNLYDYDMYKVELSEGTSLLCCFEPSLDPSTSDDQTKDGKPHPLRELEFLDWMRDGMNESFARANIFFFEPQIESHHLSLFDLPEGYGCKRSSDFYDPIDEKFEFKPLDLETPQQMTVDAALMLPNSLDLSAWTTQTATVKIIAGSMDVLHKYMIVETQQRVANVQPPRTISQKNVYDLSNAYHNILYSMDKETNECKIEKVSDKFGSVIQFDTTINDKNVTNDVKMASQTNVKFNLDNINTLFADNPAYQLISNRAPIGEGDASSSVVNERVLTHERFVKDFEAGGLKGLASVVRKSVVVTPLLADPFRIAKSPAIKQMTVTIYVYDATSSLDNNNKKRKLKAKLTLRLYEHIMINRMYLHKQLDISDCIDEQKQEYATIKYPLESPDIGRLLASQTELIYKEFVKTMFIVIGLEPTQLCKVDITFDNYNMFVRMLLLDGPPKHMRYKMLNNNGLNKDSKSGVMIEEIQATSELCAQACEFYKCQGFSHCTNGRCTLYIRDASNSDEKTFADSVMSYLGCTLFEDNQNTVSHMMSPHKVISRVKNWLKLTEDITTTNNDANSDNNQNDEPNQQVDDGMQIDSQSQAATTFDYNKAKTLADYLSLHIRLLGTKWMHLTPFSIESDLIDEDDLFRERKFSSNNEQSLIDGPKDVRNYLEDKLVQAQYLIELEGRKFDVPSKDYQYTESDHLTYQDCATFCQDSDCRSFSYCDTEMECIITKLHKPTVIQSHTVKNVHCTVFMRDYLSKFELFPNAPRPETDTKPREVKNVRECASICMESTDMDCLSFEYCPKGQCYLHSLHGRTSMLENAVRQVVSSKALDSCDHYSRSFLADFDRYLNAHLEIPEEAAPLVAEETGEKESQNQLLVTGIDTETCAKMCIENDHCAGFTVCFDPMSSIKLECSLAQVQLKKNYVTSESNCDTYLLSPKSQYTTLERSVLPGDSKKQQLKESEEALTHSDHGLDQQADNSLSWFTRISLLICGAAIGSGTVFLACLVKKERFQQVVQNFRR